MPYAQSLPHITRECQSAGTAQDAALCHSLKYTAKQYENVPSSLFRLSNWVHFRVTWNAATRHYDKTPLKACGRGAAKSNDPATWSDFRAALAALAGKSGHTLGFALPADRSITLIDLDKARDPETGAIADWAAPILARFRGTYIEISVSGEGFHIWLLGTSPDPKGRRRGGVEIYSGGVDAGRMVSVTGAAYDGAPPLLAPLQGALDALYADLFPPTPKAAPATPQRDYAPLSMDDTELLTRARNHPDPRKAARFIALFDRGDISGYKSRSEAVLALADDLAYYCGPSGDAHVDELLQQSALMDDKLGRADYRARTIAKAYEGKTAFFQPKPLKPAEPAPRRNQDEKPMSDELAAALARIAELEAELERKTANVVSMNEKQTQLREIVRAPGEQAAPAEKLLAIELLFSTVWGTAQRDGDGFAEGCITLAASKIGVSKSTGNKAFSVLTSMGVYRTKELPPVMTENGPQARIAIAPGPALLRPQEWQRPDGPRKHGGAREGAGRKPKCSECGSENVVEQIMTQVVKRKIIETRCRECGAIHSERIGPDTVVEIRAENQDEKDGTTDAQLDTSVSVEASTHTHLETPADTTPEIKMISPPPARPCIKCRAYDWRSDDDGAHWYCGSCPPTDGKQAERQVS